MEGQRSDPQTQDSAEARHPMAQGSIYWVNQNTAWSLPGGLMQYLQESPLLLFVRLAVADKLGDKGTSLRFHRLSVKRTMGFAQRTFQHAWKHLSQVLEPPVFCGRL